MVYSWIHCLFRPLKIAHRGSGLYEPKLHFALSRHLVKDSEWYWLLEWFLCEEEGRQVGGVNDEEEHGEDPPETCKRPAWHRSRCVSGSWKPILKAKLKSIYSLSNIIMRSSNFQHTLYITIKFPYKRSYFPAESTICQAQKKRRNRCVF